MPKTPLLDLLKLLVFGPFQWFLLFLDRYVFTVNSFFGCNPFLGDVPRTVGEAIRPRQRLFRLLKEHNPAAIPANAEFVDLKVHGGAEHEKDKSVVLADILVRSNTTLTSTTAASASASSPSSSSSSSSSGSNVIAIPIFAKMPTARSWSLMFKTIVATFSPEHKEVAFFNSVLPLLVKDAIERNNGSSSNNNTNSSSDSSYGAGVEKLLGFETPKNLYSSWSKAFDRCVLISECIDMTQFHSHPDFNNPTTAMVKLMLSKISFLHASSWCLRRKPIQHICRTFFPREEVGIDWLSGAVELYQSGCGASQLAMWDLLKDRLSKEPVCLSHSDFRGGNMLFSRDWKQDNRLVVTDWEAISVTVFLWDVMYCMCCSLAPEERAAEEKNIVNFYLQNLRTKIPEQEQEAVPVPSLEDALDTIHLLKLALRYLSWALTIFGAVGKKHNNSEQDVKSWEEKLTASTDEVMRDPDMLARLLKQKHANSSKSQSEVEKICRDFTSDHKLRKILINADH